MKKRWFWLRYLGETQIKSSQFKKSSIGGAREKKQKEAQSNEPDAEKEPALTEEKQILYSLHQQDKWD